MFAAAAVATVRNSHGQKWLVAWVMEGSFGFERPLDLELGSLLKSTGTNCTQKETEV